MTISRSTMNRNMRPRGRSPGWAALDKNQREKQSPGPKPVVDPFPSITNFTKPVPTNGFLTNHCKPVKTFSSAVCPSKEFPVLLGCKNKSLDNGYGTEHQYQNTNLKVVKLLKDIHSWADEALILDILSAVNNNADHASILLKEMVPPESKPEGALSGASSSSACPLSDTKNNCSGKAVLVENKSPNGTHEILLPRQLLSLPVEPEWEEDDIYLIHRKDAIKMMRAASQHSRAASNAFLRGDHVSAQQFSAMARREWLAAEQLNSEAAEKILLIRNTDNDMWKLDLHGLHATEAVAALKKHLCKIESQTVMNRSSSLDGLAKLESAVFHSPSSVGSFDLDTETKEKPLPQQRPTVLYVITGMGNHSQGQAALPVTIRSFLIENGYRFDDARAGVIAIRPKFRYK